MRRTSHVLLGIVAIVGAGCGDDDAPGDGTPDGGATTGTAIAAPQIPWWDPETDTETLAIAPPNLSPCPAGWRETRTASDLAVCDPWPSGGPATCPAGQAHFPGAPGCSTVGAACPAGDFPEGLPATGTIRYVRSSAIAGDGSLARPFGTLTEAIAGAPAGTTIAIAKGRYDERLAIPPGITLWGACAAQTELTVTEPVVPGGVGGALYVTAGAVVVRNLHITQPTWIAVWAEGATTSIELHGVIVSGATTQGVHVRQGASLTANEVVVEDTRPRLRDGVGGNGFAVEEGAHATLSRVVIARNRFLGVAVSGASTLDLSDVAVSDTEPEMSTGLQGIGVAVEGGVVRGERIVVERNKGAGLALVGADADVSDLVVRDTSELSDGTAGNAILAYGGATGRVARALFDRNATTTINVIDSRLTFEDIVVRDTQPGVADPENGGWGAMFADAATIVLSRVVIEGSRNLALLIDNPTTTVQASDLLIRDTTATSTPGIPSAPSILVQGARASLERARLERSLAGGIIAKEGATVTLADTVVAQVASNPMGRGLGTGLMVEDSGTLITSRVLIERVQGLGIVLSHGNLEATDLVVRDGEPTDTGYQGRGVLLQDASVAHIERAVIERSRDVGLIVHGLVTRLDAQDIRIRDTRERGCAAAACADDPAGTALTVAGHATAALTRFALERASLCGAQLGGGATLDLREGEIAQASIGACVQIPDYDLTRLTDRVVYRDNGVNLQATTLPVPEPYVPESGL